MKPIRDLRSYGDFLVGRADPTEGGRIARRAMAEPLRRTHWLRRVIVVMGSVVTLVGANVGMAFAANGSIPGDPLYGLDRAYERVEIAIGLHPNLAAERFDEASKLVDRGDIAAAFETASEGAADLDGSSGIGATLSQLARDLGEANMAALPTDVRQALTQQAQELFGIGKAVSTAATTHLSEAMSSRAEQVLTTVRLAQEEMRQAREDFVPPGQTDNPGLGGETPPGQDGTPGKSDEAPGQDGTPGKSGDAPGQDASSK